MNDFSNYGNQLKKIRELKGLSLREVAQKLNVDHSHLHRIEKGNFPSIPLLNNLLEAYNLSLNDFFSMSTNANKNQNIKWTKVIEKFEYKGITPDEMLKFMSVIEKLT